MEKSRSWAKVICSSGSWQIRRHRTEWVDSGYEVLIGFMMFFPLFFLPKNGSIGVSRGIGRVVLSTWHSRPCFKDLKNDVPKSSLVE